MNPLLAAVLMLVATVEAGATAPAIDEGAMKAALEKGKVKVAKLERHLGPPDVPDGAFARACRNWNLTEAQTLSFLSRATAISPDELHSTYAVVSCQFSGEISINGEVYKLSVNAGSFAVIRGAKPERVALFGCKQVCRDVFRISAEDQ
jgi:hypothetical protein